MRWDRLRRTKFPPNHRRGTMSWNQAAELNGDSCLTLSQILASFGAPISEEQGRTAPIDEPHFVTNSISYFPTFYSLSLL